MRCISMDEDGWKAVKPFVEKTAMNYRVMLGNDRVGKLFGGVDSLPTTFIIDRDGGIASQRDGLVSKSSSETEIARLLEAR